MSPKTAKPKAKSPAKKAAPKAKKAKALSLKGLGITLGRPLRAEILSRSKEAFANADSKSEEHVTRCHNVTKKSLAYRLPSDRRTERGQAVVVTREGGKVTITDRVVGGVNPILGWPE